jgi:hypothetical protein
MYGHAHMAQNVNSPRCCTHRSGDTYISRNEIYLHMVLCRYVIVSGTLVIRGPGLRMFGTEGGRGFVALTTKTGLRRSSSEMESESARIQRMRIRLHTPITYSKIPHTYLPLPYS